MITCKVTDEQYDRDRHVCSPRMHGTSNRSNDNDTSSTHARPTSRRRPRPQTSTTAGRSLAAALTLGVALATTVTAIAAGGGAGTPPPPPPSNNYEGNRRGDGGSTWAGWAPPPPPPPSPPPAGSHILPNTDDGWGGGGVGGTSSRAAAAGGGGGGGASGFDQRQQHGQQQQDQQVSRNGKSNGSGSTSFDRMHNAMPEQQQQQQQQQQQSSLHERMATARQAMQHPQPGQGSPAAYRAGQDEWQQPPPSWHHQQSSNPSTAVRQPPPPPPPPQSSSAASNPEASFYDSGSSSYTSNADGMQHQQQQQFGEGGEGRPGMAMMGGAGDGRWPGEASSTPSHATAGAVTPEVKLSQYRQGGGGASATTSTEGGDIPRSLLSNTDKEVIFDGLKKLYRKKILPLEESSRYAHFHSPPMNPADFEAKPMVLIVGQYSVGKTSFIRSLLKRDFPGQRVGPEPTTDRFVAVTHGDDERVMPGHALAMQTDKPFRSLQQFGNNFLTKFEGSVVDAPILRNITLVDTPGVLSGEKQRIGRDYDFASVISWFAERADLIVVMFDAHKLDISDELKMVIDTLKPHHDKMRVLLNKADTIDTQQLMRVYGALMWSLGKVMQTPEVCRVYIGSFWEAPLSNFENRFLLEREKQDLLEELRQLPENAVVRRINELVKRARSVKVHAYIIHYLRKQMPYMMGKQDKQERLIRRLDQEFLACARRYGLPLGDFPKVEKFRRSLREIKDISKFQRLDKSMVAEMDKVFAGDIPKLMEKAARPVNNR